MKLTLRAGGIVRKGPERDLVDDYVKRANGLTNACGFHSVTEQQVDLRRDKTRSDETNSLLGNIPDAAVLVVLDEKGKALTSRKMAQFFDNQRRDGTPEIVIAIGGADGFEPENIPPGTHKWSFGIQTWPHKLVRVMMAEQIYRSLSILAGTPYHRD